ncbi:MAG: FtsX-like permease family protein [Cyclobacteriaceae bacterium]
MQTPSRWSSKLLKWFCPDKLYEGIEGDLLEQFEKDAQSGGLRAARRRFSWSVIRFFHPSILLRNKFKQLNNAGMGMYKSHLLVAYRSMMKHKFYSFINIFGLAMAVAFVFLSFLFVNKELGYDQFHENDSIYRLFSQVRNATTEETEFSGRRSAIVSIPLASDMAGQTPSISMYSRVASNSGTVLQDQTPYQETIHFVDPDFLSMFSFPILSGSSNALDNPNTVVLSQESARKFFGSTDPMGKTLEITFNDSSQLFLVTGLVDNLAEQSSINFDLLVPFETFATVAGRSMNSYRTASIEAYVIFENPDVSKGLSPVLTSAVSKFTSDDDTILEIGIQPMTDVHLQPEIGGNAGTVNPKKLYTMSLLAFLVLMVAIINFITLSTSHSLKRLREMGLRKTLGAFKGQMRGQLILESFFVSFLAGLLGMGLAYLVTPYFNQLLEMSLVFAIDLISVAFVFAIALLIASVSGAIQSLVLIKYKAVDALKGTNVAVKKDSLLNQSLLVLQFALSITLIIGTLVIRAQMNFIQNKDLGYDKERLVEIGMQSPSDIASSQNLLNRFRQELEKDTRILSVSASMNSFREPWTQFGIRQVDETVEQVFFNKIDGKYVKTMGIELTRGVDFDANSSNKSKVLVNEALVKHFGWEDPLSEQIPGKNYTSNHQIIGVFKDFHFSTLHDKIEPLALSVEGGAIREGVTGLSTYVWPINLYTAVLRLGPGDLQGILHFVETSWGEVNPTQPFVYSFVDDVLAKNYEEEMRWQKVIDSASIFSIAIAWLGLLGLTKLSVQKRVKEIGIRKVLGSTVTDITSLLSKKFLLLIVISNAIAWPAAWLLSEKWLQDFTYRITISPIPFLLGGLGVLVVALASVGYQSLRAASSNPVDSLKCE